MTDVAIMERSDVEVTPTSWQPIGEMSFEEWCEAGSKLGQIAEAVQWWIGDWINYGANTYGAKYRKALNALSYEYGSLRNMASIADQFELSRRRDNLSWSHHVAVASLPQVKQDTILDRAEEEGWTREQLRASLGGNGSRNGRGVAPGLTSRITFEQTFPNKALQKTTVASLRAEAEKLGFTEKRVAA